MPKFVKRYVRYIDKLSHTVGHAIMYPVFVMIVALAIGMTYPQVTLWLPEVVFSRQSMND